MCVCVCAERDVPVSPVHALRDEVQPDVQGQPDSAHPGGGGPERLIGRRERGLAAAARRDARPLSISIQYRGDALILYKYI